MSNTMLLSIVLINTGISLLVCLACDWVFYGDEWKESENGKSDSVQETGA